uniref:Uncharacterized protein n=1 Tax=Amphora coffeiformis TaxID=265554 RepID=A0A7S3L192_9STRA
MSTTFGDKRPVPFGSPGELEALFPSFEGTKRRPNTRFSTTSIVALTLLAVFAFCSTRTTRYGSFSTTSNTISSVTTNATTEPSSVITPEITGPDTEVVTTTAATTTVETTKSTEAYTAEETYRRFTTYQVNWGAYHPCIFPYCVFPGSSYAGCMLGTGPATQISCGDGGSLDFTPQSNCRLQKQTGKPTLRCQGTTDLMDRVEVSCHGMQDEALQLDVQVEQRTYQCNGVLNEQHNFDGVVIQRGGTAGQRVSVSTLQDNDTWSEILSNSQTGGCSTHRQCSDAYASCETPTSCGAYVPYIFGSAAKYDAMMGARKSEGVVGTPCTLHHDCQSGDCSKGTCS